MRNAWLLPGLLLGVLAFSASQANGQTPRLRLTSPTTGSAVSGTVPITIEVPDDVQVSFVVFGIDGSRPVSTNARPFTCTWDTVAYPDGVHVLSVEAYGPGGLVASTGPIRVDVRNEVRAVRAPAPAPRSIGSEAESSPRLAGLAAAPSPARLATPCGPQQGVELSVSLNRGDAFVPLRTVVESMGGKITWLSQGRVAIADCRGRTVELANWNEEAVVNGVEVRLTREPRVEGGRMMVAARLCAVLFGLQVAWDGSRHVVVVG